MNKVSGARICTTHNHIARTVNTDVFPYLIRSLSLLNFPCLIFPNVSCCSIVSLVSNVPINVYESHGTCLEIASLFFLFVFATLSFDYSCNNKATVNKESNTPE